MHEADPWLLQSSGTMLLLLLWAAVVACAIAS